MVAKMLRISISCVCTLTLMLGFVAGAMATTWTVPTGSDPVANGSNFQSSLNNAQCADTIVLQAGATYQGSFVLPYKGACTGTDADYITIQTSATLPSGRLDPKTQAASLALVRSVNDRAIRQAANAHHYKLVGLDISTTGNMASYVPDLVNWGADGSAAGGYATYSELLNARNFVIDRCFIHPAEVTAAQLVNNSVLYRTSGRGLGLNGINLTVQNSYIGGFTGYYPNTATKIDSYGVYVTAGPGPLTITNNYIEAGFNNIFLGGADTGSPNSATVSPGATTSQVTLSSVQNLNVGDYIAFYFAAGFKNSVGNTMRWGTARVTAISGNTVTYQAEGPSGIPSAPDMPGAAQWNGLMLNGGTTIKQNTLYKQPQWATDFPGLGKAFIEIKQVDGLMFDGNLLDGNPVGGAGVALTTRNQGSGSPWMVIRNVTISNTRVTTGAASRITLQLLDNENTATSGGNITVTNSLIPPMAMQALQTSGGSTVTVAHNTFHGSGSAPVYNTGPAAISNGQQWGMTGLVVRDNIFNFGAYGFNANSPNGYKGAWPPNGIAEQKNVVINSGSVTEPSPTWPGQMPNSYIVSTDEAVGFVNVATADGGGDYHGYALASTSPFKGKASDGADPGVDFAALDAASSGSGTTGGTTGGSTGGLPGPTNLIVK